MEIRRKAVRDLTPTEYRACYLANYGTNGYMQESIRDSRTTSDPGTVIMLWDGSDDSVSSLIGWVMLTPVRRNGPLAASTTVMRNSKYTVQFWVKRRHRRKGYGKILMNEVKKLDPNPHVMPHDRASSEFLSSYKAQVMREDYRWYRKKPRVA